MYIPNEESPHPIQQYIMPLFHTEALIRRAVVQHLIWVRTVCLCPTNTTLGLYGVIRISQQNDTLWEPNMFNLMENTLITLCLKLKSYLCL